MARRALTLGSLWLLFGCGVTPLKNDTRPIPLAGSAQGSVVSSVHSDGRAVAGPAMPRLEVQLGGPSVGTAHPLELQRVSTSGSWVFYCQAREDTDHNGRIEVTHGFHGGLGGDHMQGYLAWAGSELAIDEFVSASEDGRWLAFIRRGKLQLADLATGERRVLAADPRGDRNPSLPHRAAFFDEDSTRLVYLRRTDEGNVVVARDLATRREVEVDVGPGEVWRAWSDGEEIWAWVVRRDTDGDDRLQLPEELSTLSDASCRGRALAWSTHGWSGDEPDLMRAPIQDGAVLRPAPSPDAAEEVDPLQKPAPATTREQWIRASEGRWLVVRADRRVAVWDETRERFAEVDLTLGTRRDVGIRRYVVSGSVVALNDDDRRDVVVDLATREVLGFVEGHVLATTSSGAVLLGQKKRGESFGPLRWATPRPG